MRVFPFRTTVAAWLLCIGLAGAQAAPPQAGVKPDGRVSVGGDSVPYSSFASPEARAFFPKMLAEGDKAPPLTAPIAQSRAFYDRMNSDRVARMQKLYAVKIRSETIAGVNKVLNALA